MRQSVSAQRRWAVNLAGWAPQPEEWAFVLRLLPDAEVADVQRFKFAKDQQLAVVSRLLQRKCAAEVLGIAFSDVQIRRTKGRKPFVVAAVDRPYAPNFNFNVSHEGNYVVLASEGHCLCGIDVAAPQQLRRGRQQPVAAHLQSFRRQFTEHEWAVINADGASEEAMADAFQRNWSLKEAFVKLRGDGLTFDIAQVEFRFTGGPAASNADAYMSGTKLSRWKCTVQTLAEKHWVSVVRGPPDAAIDAWGEFTATLQRPDMADEELQAHLAQGEKAFQVLSICDLVPADQLAGFSAAGGDVL